MKAITLHRHSVERGIEKVSALDAVHHADVGGRRARPNTEVPTG